MAFETLHFVGRQAELKLWSDILASSDGQSVLVVGRPGSGKSAFIDQIILNTWTDTELNCGAVRYDVPTDESPEETMRFMLEDAFYSARASAGAIDIPSVRFWQWGAFFDSIGITRKKIESVQTLVNTIRFDPQKHIGEQFKRRLHALSEAMGPDSRAIFVIDRSGHFSESFVEQWINLTKDIPPKIIFVLSQLPEDPLVNNTDFLALGNVKTIPADHADGLGPLGQTDFDSLLNFFSPKLRVDVNDLKSLYTRYGGDPYLLRSAFDLLLSDPDMKFSDLPIEANSAKMALRQWSRVKKFGYKTTMLFRAYSILDVTAPDEIVMSVAGLDLPTFKQTLDIPYVRTLIRSRPNGHQIADRQLLETIYAETSSRIEQPTALDLHHKAIIALESLLQRNLKPDPFCSARIPEHALAIGGPYAFARAVAEMSEPLISLCHYDTVLRLIQRALDSVEPDSRENGQLRYQIGLVLLKRNFPDVAEPHFNEAVRILHNSGDTDTLPDVLLTLGKLEIEKQNFYLAETFLNEAYDGYVINDDPQGMVDAAISLGQTLWYSDRRSEAESMLCSATETANRIEYNRQLLRSKASICSMFGSLYEKSGDHDKADKYYHQALDLTQDICDRESEAKIYTNLRTLLESNGGYSKAEEYELKALTIHKELRDMEAMALDYMNLAFISFKMEDKETARKRLEEAKNLYAQLGNKDKVDEITGKIKRLNL